MNLRYADTSALVCCYFPDEPDHEELRALLLEGVEPVVTSELTRLEMTSAVHAAHRAGRVADPVELLEVVDVDCGDAGPIALLRLQTEVVLGAATALVAEHALRSLDALHLAVARIPPLTLLPVSRSCWSPAITGKRPPQPHWVCPWSNRAASAGRYAAGPVER